MIQTRIDRIYISPNLEHTGGSTEILPTIPDISNHASIVLYKKSTNRRTPRTLFFNKRFLQNEDNKASLLVTWKEVMDSNIETWNQKMVSATQAIRLKIWRNDKDSRTKLEGSKPGAIWWYQCCRGGTPTYWASKEAWDKLSDAQTDLHEVRHRKF